MSYNTEDLKGFFNKAIKSKSLKIRNIEKYLMVLERDLAMLKKAQAGAEIQLFITTDFGQVFPKPEEKISSFGLDIEESPKKIAKRIGKSDLWGPFRKQLIATYEKEIENQLKILAKIYGIEYI